MRWESKEQYRETYELCQRIGFAGMHVFPYSIRPGTTAAPGTPAEVLDHNPRGTAPPGTPAEGKEEAPKKGLIPLLEHFENATKNKEVNMKKKWDFCLGKYDN